MSVSEIGFGGLMAMVFDMIRFDPTVLRVRFLTLVRIPLLGNLRSLNSLNTLRPENTLRDNDLPRFVE